MNHQLLRPGLFSVLAMLLFLVPARTFGQAASQDLLNRFIDQRFEKITLLYVLDSIRQKYDVPILFEVADSGFKSGNPVDLNTFDMNIEPGKLNEVLDSIIRQKPNYKWEVIDGVVNFTPTAKRNPLIEKLFDTRIKSFSLKNYIFIDEVDKKLAALPEVKRFLKSSDSKINDIYEWSILGNGPFPENEINLSLSDLTFKALLNQIVRQTPDNFRIVFVKIEEFRGKSHRVIHI
jgi:hypothetical protein